MPATSHVYFEIYTNEDRPLHWITVTIVEAINQFPWIGVLLVLMLLDVITGIVAAAIRKEVSSKVSQKGVFKKVQMILLVGVGMIFEVIYSELPWGKIIAIFFITHEMLSITENAGKSGLPLPKQLMDSLAKSRAEDSDRPEVKIEILQERGEKGEKGDKGDTGKSIQEKEVV